MGRDQFISELTAELACFRRQAAARLRGRAADSDNLI
jgi:hypothetical protein